MARRASQDEARTLAWVRAFYRDLFAESGGVPVPGPGTDGARVPWHTIYYQGNYPRLQQIKRRYDPLNIFHHALSIAG